MFWNILFKQWLILEFSGVSFNVVREVLNLGKDVNKDVSDVVNKKLLVKRSDF